MGSLADIRTEIKRVIETVPEIGTVHEYERWLADEKRMKELCWHEDLQAIRFWELTREATPSSDQDSEREARAHQWVARGYMPVKDADASELFWQQKAEEICEVLRAERMTPAPLNGRAHVLGPISVRSFAPWMRAGMLMHRVEIVFTTTVVE